MAIFMKKLDISQNKTMSSREIAELTGKQHKNVIRDVEILNKSYLELGLLKIEPSSYINSLLINIYA